MDDIYHRVAKGIPSYATRTLFDDTEKRFYDVYCPRIGRLTFVAEFKTPEDAIEEAKKYKQQCQKHIRESQTHVTQ